MAAPSAQTLQRIADETGHQPGTLEKVLRLLDLLQEIARDPVLSERLVLKGGTALRSCQHLDRAAARAQAGARSFIDRRKQTLD